MKAVCPKDDKHKEFYTVTHILQEWRVDEHGQFIDIARNGEALETVHGPHKDNLWVCATCGCEAKVT